MSEFYLLSILLFTLSSFFCGIAPTLPILILFRVLQGLGGGGLQPTTQAILADLFPKEKVAVAFTLYSVDTWTRAGRMAQRSLGMALDFLPQYSMRHRGLSAEPGSATTRAQSSHQRSLGRLSRTYQYCVRPWMPGVCSGSWRTFGLVCLARHHDGSHGVVRRPAVSRLPQITPDKASDSSASSSRKPQFLVSRAS
jgi:hypothetical protein